MSVTSSTRRWGGGHRALFLLAAVLFALCLLPGVALAKSGSTPIPTTDPAYPASETVVFTVSLAGETYTYTWADVCGTGRLGPLATCTYLKEDPLRDPPQHPEQWSGVWLRSVLSDVEQRSGITLAPTWRLKVTAVDDYVCSLAVSSIKDPANNYLLGKDPVWGYPDGQPERKYAPTYVRICTNGDYGNTAFPARLVKPGLSATVLNKDRTEVAHGPLGLIVTGDDVSAASSTKTYSGDAYWITQREPAELKASRGSAGSHTALWKRSTAYSHCHDHGQATYGYSMAAGIGLREFLAAAGCSLAGTGAYPVSVSATDGFTCTIDLREQRYVYRTPNAAGEAGRTPVDPMLALYRDVRTSFAELPLEATTALVSEQPTFLQGQLTVGESNECKYVKDSLELALATASPAVVVDAPDASDSATRQKNPFTLARLISKGDTRRVFTVNGHAVACHGLSLADVIALSRGRICPQDTITVKTTAGDASLGRTVTVADAASCFLAYYSADAASGTPVANSTQVMLYGANLAVANVTAIEIQHVDPVRRLTISSPTASQGRANVARGARLALQADVVLAPGAVSPGRPTWRSSNTKVATVAANGTVSARGCGSAIISVASGSRSATFTVRVVARAVNATRVTLPGAKSLAAGQSARLLPALSPVSSTSTLFWTSSNTAVVRVDRTGAVTALKKGRVTITVRTNNGKVARCIVTVK